VREKNKKSIFWNCGTVLHHLTASLSINKNNAARLHLLLMCSRYSRISLSMLSLSRARHSMAGDVHVWWAALSTPHWGVKVTACNFDSIVHLEILASDNLVHLYMGGKHKGHPIHAMKTQRGGRGMALPIHNLSTRMVWVVNTTPQPLYPWERDPVLIVQGGSVALTASLGRSRLHQGSNSGLSNP
jgi:hypothetical protein